MTAVRLNLAIWGGAVLLCGFGLWRAFELRWVADDAFICFRYAEQALAGHGLVFNPGERVEGYSNFLWTILVLCGMKAGFDPIRWSQALGMLCYAGLLGLFLGFSWRLTRSAGAPFLPIAAACLASIWSVQSFATSGLEPMCLALLGGAGLVTLVFSKGTADYALAGVLFSAAIMTRIDGGLFYAAGVMGVVIWDARDEQPWRRLAALILPAVFLVGPFFALRFAYYGYLLPNTYYAKSGGLPYWSQGFYYVTRFFGAYRPLAVAAPALAIALWPGPRANGERSRFWLDADRDVRRAATFTAVICALELLYVCRVGGDFMFARFLVPVTPFLCVGLELGVRRLRPARLRGAIALALPALLLGESVLDAHGPVRFGRGIGEERAAYPASAIEEAMTKGAVLKRYLSGTNAQVLFRGSQAMLAHYAAFPIAIEGYGLTDVYLAHLPLTTRGRPGHEKPVRMDYLWRRGVHFLFASGLVRLPPAPDYQKIQLGGVDGQILVYDRMLMEKIGRLEGATFVRFDVYLDEYVRDLPSKSREQVRDDYTAFRRYYFDKNPDPERQRVFDAYR